MRKTFVICVAFSVLAAALTTCKGPVTASETPHLEATEAPEGKSPTEPPPPATPEQTSLAALPPEPRTIEFQASDGQTLQGTYYPSAFNPAPVVVLMHWAPGDQSDWVEIAYWLQNRGLLGQGSQGMVPVWKNPSWYPQFPSDLGVQSFAVFAFTFRQCDGGCRAFIGSQWLLDAQAAMQQARQLEGIDPQRMTAVGASIGADGSHDACYWINDQFSDSCLGALAFSPGGYLTVDYPSAVDQLGDEDTPKPAWCGYAVSDPDSAAACQAASGGNYRRIEFAARPGVTLNSEAYLHGMGLFDPNLEPDALLLMADFLRLSLGL